MLVHKPNSSEQDGCWPAASRGEAQVLEMNHLVASAGVRAVIRFRANSLIGKAGFTFDDRDDLEQELWCDLVRRVRHYDPAKSGLTTFVSRIAEHKVADLLESRHAQKRDWRLGCTSIDDPEFHHEYAGPSSEGVSDLQADVRRVLSGLAPDLTRTAIVLQYCCPSQAARRLGVSRRTLAHRLNAIREHFDAAGMQQYLGGSPSGATACHARRPTPGSEVM